ncbi:sulfite exporter TauE/SafE family protein [Roseivirga sp. E12]|uniref:sulfite exporter TauE/SafE family protein n=1 Tax=Roseivirga sp. E12 TaxID=2819237 RepID=UPI001ABC672C|nr:sulfite exporter TauE/SafE family protein [Roseivirga sp. E12]MBO3699349.1 sulfite exporter TauE/SafE family protein [Roseivirga sp. E12]
MDLLNILILFVIGLLAGVINTLAGGGSLLTLPVLIFMGLPPNVANATNRIGIFFNGIFAIKGFQSKGSKIDKYSIWLGIAAFCGAIIGSLIAVDIKGETFNRILASVIILVVAYMLFGTKISSNEAERVDPKAKVFGVIAFFIIGIYGGFLQAGVGYLIMAALTFINRFSLLKTNVTKVIVVPIYTLASLGVFIYNDLIDWELGIALAVGSALGGWLTSRWSTRVNDQWIRYFVMLTAFAFAIKLFFF